MRIVHFYVFPLFFFASFFFSEGLLAQESEGIEDSIVKDITVMKENKYIAPQLKNLSKLYWLLGMFDIHDDLAIEYFLKINDCDLYDQFYSNDLEWKKILNAIRQHVTQNMSTFPTRFEIIQPLYLGRYNTKEEFFPVLKESQLDSARRFSYVYEKWDHNASSDCFLQDVYPLYPDGLIVELNRPFSLKKVPVKKELAKLYIEDAQKYYATLPPHMRTMTYERIAYLRLKIRVLQFKERIDIGSLDYRTAVYAVLEGYEVYADVEKTKPLYSYDEDVDDFFSLSPK